MPRLNLVKKFNSLNMRKISFTLLIITLLCVNGVMAQWSGSGTSSNPYLIQTDLDLKQLSDSVNAGNDYSGKYFLQTADIDMSENFSDGFPMIGHYVLEGQNLIEYVFSGTYDGGGHSINKLKVVGEEDAALFFYVKNGAVKKLNILNADLYGTYMGVIASMLEESEISEVTVSANLNELSLFSAGGIAEYAYHGSKIRNCVAILNVNFPDTPYDYPNTNSLSGLAGICGYMEDRTCYVENCLVSVNVVNPLQLRYEFSPFITGSGIVNQCVITETNSESGLYGEADGVFYVNCYIDHQNTALETYPYTGPMPDGLSLATTAQLVSGSLMNLGDWEETPGLYPRPAAVANTDIALLAASPMMLNERDCIRSVVNNFTVNTSNDVIWESESSSVSINGSNATVTLHQNVEEAEIYAYRNNVMKTITLSVESNVLGSAGNPLTIDNENDLFDFAAAVNGRSTYKGVSLESTFDMYFRLTSDITLSRGWTPIGGLFREEGIPFSGNFDGDNHKISNLTFQSGYEEDFFALFGYVDGATISRLDVGCNIAVSSALDYFTVAGLIAVLQSSIIDGCRVTGTIECAGQGNVYAAGIAADASNATIKRCSNEANIIVGEDAVCGGIVAYCAVLDIIGCANFGRLSGHSCAIAAAVYGGESQITTIDGCVYYGESVGRFANIENGYEDNDILHVKNCILSNWGFDNVNWNIQNIFFDKQMCTDNSTSEYLGLNTSQMIGASPSAFADMNNGFWSFGEGRYPVPAGLKIDSDAATLALYPIRLANNETIDRVTRNFTLPSIDGAVWTVLDNYNGLDYDADVLEISGNTVLVTPGDSTVWSIIEVTLNETSRVCEFSIAPLGEFEIATAMDFYDFAKAINNSSNGSGIYHGASFGTFGDATTFYITDDIDFSTLPDTLEMPTVEYFKGTLLGGGHTISNVKLSTVPIVNGRSDVRGGLFAVIRGSVDSLNVVVNDNIDATNIARSGILCAVADTNSVITNCNVTLNSEYTVRTGGIVCGFTQFATLTNCNTYGTGTIKSVVITSSNSSSNYREFFGGVVGECIETSVTNCTNNVTVRSTAEKISAGGIAGSMYRLHMENCTNNAAVSGNCAGGIVGDVDNNYGYTTYGCTIQHSVNNGSISGKNAGGVIGYVECYGSGRKVGCDINNCINTGDVFGTGCAGGIAAFFHPLEGHISNCANYGTISNDYGSGPESHSYLGGIVANTNEYINVDGEEVEINIASNIVISPFAYTATNDTSSYVTAIALGSEENNFFDEQISEVDPIMRKKLVSTGTPLTTSEMVGYSLEDRLPFGWSFANNLYPLPGGVEETPRIRLSRIPIFFSSEGVGRNERPSDVITSITLPQIDGVTWSSDSPILTVPANGGQVAIVHQQEATEVTITATYNGETRDFVLNIHELAGTSAAAPSIITDAEGFSAINSTNCGAYHLYYQLDSEDPIVVNQTIDLFQGTLDGNGNELVLNDSQRGLFDITNKAEISNLNVYAVSVELQDYATIFGCIVDEAYATIIKNCAVNGFIEAVSSAGGIVGEAYDGTEISGCSFAGSLFAPDAMGGIAGVANNTVIRNCISGPSFQKLSIEEEPHTWKSPYDEYEEDDDAHNYFYGAIAGVCDGLEVDTCIVVGQSYDVDWAYVVVASPENLTVNTCYYDMQMWGAGGHYDNVVSLSTREMANGSTFSGMSGWTVAQNRYPVPTGISTYKSAVLLSEPLFIAENDIDYNHVSALSFDESGNAQWDVYEDMFGYIEYDGGFNVGCVVEEADTVVAVIVSAIPIEGTNYSYSLYRNITDIKGLISYTLTSDVACEGSEFTIAVATVDAYGFAWDLPASLSEYVVAGGSENDSTITLHIPSGLINDDFAFEPIDFSVNVDISVTGCTTSPSKTIDLSVAPSAMHYSIPNFRSNVCVGDEIDLEFQLDEEYAAEHTDVAESFTIEWYDAATNEFLGFGTDYYLPSIVDNKDYRVVFISSYLDDFECRDTVNLNLNAVVGTEISVISGNLDQQLCEGEVMEPVVISVASPENNLPDGIYADYDKEANLLTLSGRPLDQSGNAYGNFVYSVSSCGFESNGSFTVTKRPRFDSGEFSQILTSGTPLDIYLSCADVSQSDVMNSIRWEGTDSETTPPSGVTVVPSDDYTTEIIGAPEPGEYMYYVTLPQTGNCSSVTYSNYIGAYDQVNLTPTALDNSICLGEGTTLSTSERPTDFDVQIDYSYAWTLSGSTDTLGVESRLEINPESVGTYTYDVTLEGKKTIGEIEAGDFIDDIDGGSYIAYKNFEFSPNNEIPEYVVMATDGDSLVIMNTMPVFHNWSDVNDDIAGIQNYSTLSQALADMNGRANTAAMLENGNDSNVASLVQSDNPDLYVPSAGELNSLLQNYDKLYFMFNDVEGNILSSTEKDDSTVYAISVNHMAFVKAAKTDEAGLVYMFNKIPRSSVSELRGRTVDLSKSGSVSVVVADHQTVSVSSDDLLCNSDSATVSLQTTYVDAEWYSTNNMFVTFASGLENIVLPEGEYVAIATDQYGACHDTVPVKVRSLSFDIPQDTTACDSLVMEIAKEDIIVKVDGEISSSTVTIYTSGTHVITVTDSENPECEEVKQINVTINQSYYGERTDFIAYGGYYVWNGDTLTAPGEYIFRDYTAAGCDSVVKLTLTASNTNYTIVVDGIVTDVNNNPMEGVKVSSFDTFVNTDESGHYSITHNISHGLVTFSLDSYNLVSYKVVSLWDTTLNVVMDRPDMDVDITPVVTESYPYVTREIMMEIANNGDGNLDWSSLVSVDNVTLVADDGQRARNTRSLWDKYSGISTNDKAEQAVATDGYYIYTASWMREGQINKYSLDGYISTFYVTGVGKIRNLAYGENCFFATDNSNKIYKIDMDRQELIGTIELDVNFPIRHCAYDKNDEVLYIGDWNSVYEVRFINSDNPTVVPVPVASGLSNVYSSAYDGLSAGGPYLWLFSQISENNGASAKIQQLKVSTGQLTGRTHYLDSLEIANSSSIAGGICATDLLYDDKFVLLANIQNSQTSNDIMVYEIARKNSWIKLDQMCGSVAPHSSSMVKITQYVTEEGSYEATVSFKSSAFNAQAVSVAFSAEVSTPVCQPATGFLAETDTFHVVNMRWDAVDLGDYDNVSYIIYETASNTAIDTVAETHYTINDPEIGQHCYFVRTLMHGVSDCVSEASDVACVGIEEFPCDVPIALSVHASASHMSLMWNNPYGVDHYDIYRDDEILVANYVGSQYSDSTATVETEYCYHVVAYYRNNECAPKASTYECATISANVCNDVPIVTVETMGNVAVVSWTSVSDILSYSVYRDGSYVTSTKDTVFLDMTLDYNTRYCYTVEIACGYGIYNMSATVCAKTGNEDAVEQWSAESIDVYPNPAAEMFYIEGQNIGGYALINSIGQVIFDKENIDEERITVDVSGLPNGVYAIRITSIDGEAVIKRITISK